MCLKPNFYLNTLNHRDKDSVRMMGFKTFGLWMILKKI